MSYIKKLLGASINNEFLMELKSNLNKINENFSQIEKFLLNFKDKESEKLIENYIAKINESYSEINRLMNDVFESTNSIKNYTEDAENLYKSIQFKLSDYLNHLNFLIANFKILNSSNQNLGRFYQFETYILEIISKSSVFISDLNSIIYQLKHSHRNPYKPLIIAGLICSFFPFINIIALIFGIHLVKLKDYRARIFGIIILVIFFISVLNVVIKIYF